MSESWKTVIWCEIVEAESTNDSFSAIDIYIHGNPAEKRESEENSYP